MSPTALHSIEAMAREAGDLARAGEIDKAHSLIDGAQRLLGPDSPPGARIAVMTAQAHCLYFAGLTTEAIATMQQAASLAAAMTDHDRHAECEATLALYYTRVGDMASTVTLARSALARASADNSAVRYRGHLALATVMQVAGLPEAFAEYRAAREYARKIDDRIAFAATVHRMANAQWMHACQQAEDGTLEDETLRQAIVGLQSSLNMLAELVPDATQVVENLLLATLLVIKQDLDAADALFELNIPRARAQDLHMELGAALAQHAVCHARHGQHARARDLVHEALQLRERKGAADQVSDAIMLRAIETVMKLVGEAAQQQRYDDLARAAWSKFRASQQHWRQMLNNKTLEVN